VDEVLVRFLAYFSPEEIVGAPVSHPDDVDEPPAIVVSSGGRSWTVLASRSDEVTVEPGAVGDPRAVVSAAPDPMLRWLWGRAGDGAVTVTGDPAWAAYLRRLLAATTR
jgi:MDMPI C-terminal domain